MRKNGEKEKHIFNGIFSQIKKRSWRKNDFKKNAARNDAISRDDKTNDIKSGNFYCSMTQKKERKDE